MRFINIRNKILFLILIKKGNPVLFSKSYFKYITNITGDVGARNLIRKNKKDFKKLTVR